MSVPVSLVIAEAAIENPPRSIVAHPSIVNHAKRLGKKPSEILLDRSYHHAAMQNDRIEHANRRGRPDIVHFALMEALATPLFSHNLLSVYIHTIDNRLITIGQGLRIPKSYHRFEGVVISLFKDRVLKSNEGAILMNLEEKISIKDLLLEIKPDVVVGLSSTGIQSSAEDVTAKYLKPDRHCVFVVGGFPRGHFSNETSRLFDYSIAIEKSSLEAHVVIARILYECEKVLSSEKKHQRQVL